MRRAACIFCLVILIGSASCFPFYWENTAGYFSASDPSAGGEIIALVNRERQNNGLPPVACDAGLSAIAQNHAEDMAGRRYFNHISPEGKSPFDRLAGAGISYRRAGENIALNREGAHSVVKLWMRSLGHRKNILGDFTKAGVGSYRGYYVLLLVKD